MLKGKDKSFFAIKITCQQQLLSSADIFANSLDPYLTFSKKSFSYTIRVSHGLALWVLIWVQTVCKGYHQTKRVTNVARKSLEINLFCCMAFHLGQHE